MPSPRCVSLVRGEAIRITRLDGCGRPVYGDNSVATSDGFVSVQYTANNTESEAITQTNAKGQNCVNVPAKTAFSNYTVVVTFCAVDPGILSLMTGQPLVVNSAGEIIGLDIDSDIDTSLSGWSLETWAGVSGSGGCEEGQTGSFGYVLTPFLRGGTLGDYTIENGAVTFTVNNAQTQSGSAWGSGPYDVQTIGGVPSPLSKPISASTHKRVLLADVATPPEPYCGVRPLLDPDVPDLESISATVDTGDPYTYDFTPTPTGTDPMWYDFGDGTWDYAPSGTISHTYETAGTYTVYGYRGGSSAMTEVVVSGA